MALIKCPECGKEISDSSRTCIHCGYPLADLPASPAPEVNITPEATDVPEVNAAPEGMDAPAVNAVPTVVDTADAAVVPASAPAPAPKKKKLGALGIIAIIVAVLAVAAVLVFTLVCFHDWEDATCEDPKTCSKCGETEGRAKGHRWGDATYDSPPICKTCKAVSDEEPSLSTQYIGGSWTVDSVIVGDDILPGEYFSLDFTFLEDGSLTMLLGGKEYTGTWKYSEVIDDMLIYMVYVDSSVYKMGYVPYDDNDLFHQKLLLVLPDDEMVVMEKLY